MPRLWWSAPFAKPEHCGLRVCFYYTRSRYSVSPARLDGCGAHFLSPFWGGREVTIMAFTPIKACKQRVCCFDQSGFYSKSLSAPKAAT